MVRISKQSERRHQFRRKHRAPSVKTGPLQDNIPNGFKAHDNAVEGDLQLQFLFQKLNN